MKHRSRILCCVLAVLLLAGCSANPYETGNSTLYILMYHNFAPDGSDCNDWTATAGSFRENIQWLQTHGYQFVLPRDLAAGTPLPDKAVMLTFDDGYLPNYEIAYPILQETGAKAAIALITQRFTEGWETYMTWDMCREMAQSGLVEIGSHGHAIHNNSEVGLQRQEGETKWAYRHRVLSDIQYSIDLIRDHVGITPEYFAYPYGATDQWAEGFLRRHFNVTVTTAGTVADLSDGLYDLPRFNVNSTTALQDILPE